MKIIKIFCILSIIVIFSACDNTIPSDVCNENKSSIPFQIKESEEIEMRGKIMDQKQIGLGYSNIKGDKLIVLYNHEVKDNKTLTNFKYAVGNNGEVYLIKYLLYQEGSENNNNRQTANNFNNQEGCIYEVIDASLIPDGTYILLCEEDYKEFSIFKVSENSVKNSSSNELNLRLEELANRELKNRWIYSEYQNGLILSIIEFESIGKDLLAWIMIEYNEMIKYYEFPATLSDNGYTGWKMGDCGNLNQYNNSIDIICTIQNNQNIFVYFSWFSDESETIHVIEFLEDETPKSVILNGRYNYPE